MKLRSIGEDEISTERRLRDARDALLTARAKADGLRMASQEAGEQVKAAETLFAEALTAHTGIKFKTGWSGGLEVEL